MQVSRAVQRKTTMTSVSGGSLGPNLHTANTTMRSATRRRRLRFRVMYFWIANKAAYIAPWKTPNCESFDTCTAWSGQTPTFTATNTNTELKEVGGRGRIWLRHPPHISTHTKSHIPSRRKHRCAGFIGCISNAFAVLFQFLENPSLSHRGLSEAQVKFLLY